MNPFMIEFRLVVDTKEGIFFRLIKKAPAYR
jgi:hypothetical protein